MILKSRHIRHTLEVFAVTIAIAVILRVYVLGLYEVPNDNMGPQILKGDVVVGIKLPFGVQLPLSHEKIGVRPPFKGELVIYRSDNGAAHLRRVVALAGDRILLMERSFQVNPPLNFKPSEKILLDMVVPPTHAFGIVDNWEVSEEVRKDGLFDMPKSEASAQMILFSKKNGDAPKTARQENFPFFRLLH